MSPLDVIEARRNGVCRICKKSIDTEKHITYDYGKEYAHTTCL